MRRSSRSYVDRLPDAALVAPDAVDLRGERRIEDERVPCEPTARDERRPDATHHVDAGVVAGEVEHRPERADHEIGRLVQGELGHVALTQLELDPRVRCVAPCDLEHLDGHVDADHAAAGALGDRDRHATGADRQLDHRPARSRCELDVERHVLGHRRRERVVDGGECVVPAHCAPS